MARRALSRVKGILLRLLRKSGLNRYAIKVASKSKRVGWRNTPLALKPEIPWHSMTISPEGACDEIMEVSAATVHSIDSPVVIFSEKLSPSDRDLIQAKFSQYATVRDHAFKVLTARQVRVASDPNNLLLIDAEGHVLNGICVAMNGATFLQERLIWPAVRNLPGHTLMASAAMGESNYYHWTFEALPRLGAVLQSGFGWDDFDHLLLRNKGHTFQLEGLRAMGCPLNRVVSEKGLSCFDCDKLTTATHPANYVPSVSAIDFLSGPFAEAVQSRGGRRGRELAERIYISRRGVRREIANETEVAVALQEKGFTPVDLSALSLFEQIQLFEEAKVIVAAHGAGLTNLVYCKPGTRVVEIFHPNHIETMYWGIAFHKQLDYKAYFLESHQEPVSIRTLFECLR